MRTVGGLYPTLCDPAWLDRTVDRAVRGKRRRPDVAWLLFRREEVVARLAAELASGAWRPGGFEVIRVHDPKPRVIARAPIEDRVVHLALADLLLPVLLRHASPADYGCRPGFGVHRAWLRLVELCRQHRYVMHLDVRAYFPSIRVDGTLALLGRRVRDRALVEVVSRALGAARGLLDDPELRRFAGLPPGVPEPGRGLPMGTSISQVLAAHLVLTDLDHRVHHALRVPGYLRYVDDLFLFGGSRARLLDARDDVASWLAVARDLTLKDPSAPARSARGGLRALGAHVSHDGARPWLRRLPAPGAARCAEARAAWALSG